MTDEGKKCPNCGAEGKLRLAIGKPFFLGPQWDSKLKGIVLAWGAETEVANLLWIKLMTISFRWPPIRVYESFTNKEGEEW